MFSQAKATIHATVRARVYDPVTEMWKDLGIISRPSRIVQFKLWCRRLMQWLTTPFILRKVKKLP